MPLSDYQLGECLYEGDRTQVYRAKGTDPDKSAIVKILRTPHPNFTQLVQFRNQYAIARHLQHPGIVRPIALERYGNGYALIMSDEGAIPLLDYWQQSHRSIGEFLEIALQLADALHYLNQQRVIHKDIKPANIIIDPKTEQVKLIDFSISSLLPKEIQALQTPNLLEGTLAYISPEQTGRMNRGIDYRSDFYSLGVTFYELLAGQLPFTSTDPMELVYCHIARYPTPPAKLWNEENTSCPPILWEIILKLMAKNAEERYQSALGLKSDLEKCRVQWKETGEIQSFVLAEQDRSDRFTIPDKLYGREIEVQTLLNAFERVTTGSSEMMLVAGFSGIGKTAIVNEVHKPIVRQRGYFIKGKYDQFNRNIPFSAFVIALRDLMGQLLGESDAELLEWKKKILSAVGENGKVIVDVIPELERIIGKQPPVPELSGSAAQNRFNLLFPKFISVFTKKEHPLVMFLDDLQWADSASLNLLKVLMGNTRTGYLLMLGAYRDNEVFSAHPLMLSLGELKKENTTISTITLAPLSVGHINQLVAETLSFPVELAAALTDLIYEKTKGNPFFATQFLKGLHENGSIAFNQDLGYWECDLVKVRDAALTDDVVEFMARRLHKLPEETQKALKLAACIGNQFDLETLAIICEKPSEEVAASLWNPLREGLILPQSEAYKFFQGWERNEGLADGITVGYRFLHDRVQQAAYSLIPEEQKQPTHYKIGQLLLCNIPIECREEKLFAIVNQLNQGISLLDSCDRVDELAELNLQAAEKAKNSTAYAAAWGYLNVGMNLLGSDIWQKNYSLSLAFHLEAIKVAYLIGNFERIEELALKVETNAKTFLDKIKIYETQIKVCISQKRQQEAIKIGLKTLEKQGLTLSQVQGSTEIDRAIGVTHSYLAENVGNVEGLINWPQMTDPGKIAAMSILSSLVPATFVANPTLFPLIVCEQVNLSILYGNSYLAAFAYANYGQILSGLDPDSDLGYQFGELAQSMLTKFDNRAIAAKVNCIFGFFIIVWKKHLRESLPILRSGYQNGLETGDLEYGSYCLLHTCENSYFVAQELSSLARDMKAARDVLCRLKQENNINYVDIYRHAVLRLIGEDRNNFILNEDAYNDRESLRYYQNQNDRYAILNVYLNKMILCFLFEEVQDAVINARLAEEYLNGVIGTPFIPVFYFYDSLIHLKASVDLVDMERDAVFKKVSNNQSKMKVWAERAAMNYAHKLHLVQAEKHRVLKQKVEASELYDKAIAGAKENEYIQEEALANELAAKFYLDWGRLRLAQDYLIEAYYCYARWGAKAKVKDLEKRYPKLLAPILQSTPSSLLTPSTIAPLGTIASTSSRTSSSSTSVALDLAAILKANQTLSSEIELDKLLSSLLSIIIENAGADKCVLMLMRDKRLLIKGSIALGTAPVVLQQIPAEQSQDIPKKLIYKVKHNLQTEVLSDARIEPTLARDPYIQQHQPQSVLCSPILHQGKLLGILYLENNLTKGAFTRERVELLNLLCAQAAISLENAQLYERSQEYAQQLEQALLDLQNAQVQLVQSEKMSALGNLVSGIGHEMNNPLSFISASLEQAKPTMADVFEHLKLYQETFPNSSKEIVEHGAKIELDYTLEDLPKILESMVMACDRLKHISRSLRTFSRADRDEKIPFNIHEGIESTVLILKHRLKANEHRPAIKIVTHYGNLPEIDCFPGQLNQVFMNIIANAIDAVDESYLSLNSTGGESRPPRITIQTSLEANQVQIRIADSGMGMTEAVKQKIFDRLFTTKGVGKGTGLGLAIARQIVEEKHGGTLLCTSEFGKGTEFTISLPLG